MKKLFVLAAAILIMGSAFAQDGVKEKKCKSDKECCKKKEDKDCCKKTEKTTIKATATATVKPIAKKV